MSESSININKGDISSGNTASITAVPESHNRSRLLLRAVITVMALIGISYYVWGNVGNRPVIIGRGLSVKGQDRNPGVGITPVIAAHARQGDIGVYITGLGSVTPIYTVTVKTRVDGQLMAVNYREGQVIQEGAALLEIDPRPYQALLEQYEGQLKRDQALLANAKVDLGRYATLMKTNAVPEQTYATQQATVNQDEGQVETDKGLIDATKLNIAYCHITAPISGVIGLRLVDPGNYVQASSGTALLVITQVRPISIIFPIAEDQLPALRGRMKSGQTLSVEGWDRDQQHRLAGGALSTLDNQIDQTTGTVRLRADFPNDDGALFPNQFVYARLLLQQKHGVVLIPTAAVQRNADATYVFVVNSDSTISTRSIGLGTTTGDETEVVSGLRAGDEVVVSGVDKLTDGVKVVAQLKESGQGGRGGQ